MVDVLSFVDEAWSNPWEDGRVYNRRQLAVNGVAIADHLSRAYGDAVASSSPVVYAQAIDAEIARAEFASRSGS